MKPWLKYAVADTIELILLLTLVVAGLVLSSMLVIFLWPYSALWLAMCIAIFIYQVIRWRIK